MQMQECRRAVKNQEQAMCIYCVTGDSNQNRRTYFILQGIIILDLPLNSMTLTVCLEKCTQKKQITV